ncbi:MAG: InlB B-repeat-containing protein [Desulfitobacteriaceae bacterium]
MRKKLTSILLLLILLICSLTVPAMATGTTISLNTPVAASGETVTVSGTSDADTWIAVKVLDSASNIVVLDFVKSAADGSYNYSFIVPPVADGILRVIGGYGSNVAKAELAVGEHHTVAVSADPAADPAAYGTVSGGGEYLKGASVTVTATANSGYTFVNWTEGGSPVSTDAAYTFTLDTTNRTLVANFIVTPPDITAGTISGTVTDGTNPIMGANVSLTVSGSVYSATTVADGSYSILNVPAGTGYTVTASKSGYTDGSATNVSVTANATTQNINITLTSDQEGCLVTYKGAQKRYNAGGNTYDIRFIAIIDTLNAKEVGFVFSKSQTIPTRENATVKATTTVYTSITAAGSTVTAGALEGTYIIACTVTGIPVSDIAVPLHVRAFSTVGTVTKYTPVATVTVNSLP